LLAQAKGTVVNVSSLAALAAVPVMAAYSISKAAGFSLTQALRALLAAQGVRVQAVLAGPVDTDMSADLAIPKASARSVASAILAGVERGDEEIFPDDVARALFGDWPAGAVKAFEQQNATLLAA
jgi:short-subunit dehydrogenase